MPRTTRLIKKHLNAVFDCSVLTAEEVAERRLGGAHTVQAWPQSESEGSSHAFTLCGFPTQDEALRAAINEVERKRRIWEWPSS